MGLKNRFVIEYWNPFKAMRWHNRLGVIFWFFALWLVIHYWYTIGFLNVSFVIDIISRLGGLEYFGLDPFTFMYMIFKLFLGSLLMMVISALYMFDRIERIFKKYRVYK